MADDISIDADDLFIQANQTTQLRSAVRDKATRIAARARQITSKDDGDATISIRENPLPNGRYGMDVVSDADDEEFGTESRKRVGALRRAAKGVGR